MRARKQTSRVIVHHSLSADVPLSMVREWHLARGWSDIGYHYIIHEDGKTEQGRSQELVGAHAFGRNGDSIGICLMGDFFDYEPSVEQLEALGDQYHGLCRFYGRRLSIEFHRWRWLPHACPGPMLDRADLLEIVYRRCPYER